jgi:hypothetical protein
MATYKDSLGNTYTELPKAPPVHKAKSTKNKIGKRAASKAKKMKHDRYRSQIGKPNGPGQPGNKSGKNKIKH